MGLQKMSITLSCQNCDTINIKYVMTLDLTYIKFIL